jgi:hypothetical protein
VSSPTYDPASAGATLDPATGRADRPADRARLAWRGLVLENLAVLAAFAVVGLVAGWLWERWATPPTGAVVDGSWNLGRRVDGDYLVGDTDSLGHAFEVVGTFVLVGAAAGLVLGVLVALLCRRSELVTLVVVAASSVLAVFLCYRVGLALGPSDPGVAASGSADGTMLSGDLAIDQLSPFVGLPLAALVGLTVTYLFTTGVSAGVTEARRLDLGPAGSPPAASPT